MIYIVTNNLTKLIPSSTRRQGNKIAHVSALQVSIWGQWTWPRILQFYSSVELLQENETGCMNLCRSMNLYSELYATLKIERKGKKEIKNLTVKKVTAETNA